MTVRVTGCGGEAGRQRKEERVRDRETDFASIVHSHMAVTAAAGLEAREEPRTHLHPDLPHWC